MQLVPLGQYKIAYWKNDAHISSQMFDSFEEAQQALFNLQKEGYLVVLMENTGVGKGSYSWKIQKGGIGSSFSFLTTLHYYRYWIGGLLAYFLYTRKRLQ